MYRFDKNSVKRLYLVLALGIGLLACKKNLPDDRLSFGSDSGFTQKFYEPVLGRTTVFTGNFNIASSSVPLNFKIVNMRRFNGDPAPELSDYFPVKVWKQAYDGTETSLAAIEAKRTIENHQLFEIRANSGQFVMWSEARSDFVRSQPDSGYVFDVEVSNSGGRRYFQNFILRPFKERPVEPSTLLPANGQDYYLGNSAVFLSGIRGKKTNRLLTSNDVRVQFRKKPAGTPGNTGNSISFRFVDSLYTTIDPNKFQTTKWGEVVHGFDMVKTSSEVTYQVAYPIPLTNYPTKYTTPNGVFARSVFRFDRIAAGGELVEASLETYYQIHEPGDWEVIFWFATEQPKFEND
jgi:hypothetical protein